MKVLLGMINSHGVQGGGASSTFSCDLCQYPLTYRKTCGPRITNGIGMVERGKTIADWLECMNETCENNGQRWAVPTIELKLLD